MLANAELLGAMGGRSLHSVMSDNVPGYLFDGCFRDRSITLFIAAPHRGKTLLMLDMAICLDMELPLFGKFKPLQGHEVFFLGCDAPSWDYGLQGRKLCIGHGITPPQRELLGVNGVWRRGFKITSPEVQRQLKLWRDATGASVLFIDTHRATHSANENDSTEMERVWDLLCNMRDDGWCIIMSHHTPKPSDVLGDDTTSGRGSSVIGASSDFIYNMAKRNRQDPRVRVSCAKGRGSSGDEEPFTFFDITSVPSDEEINGRPLYGIRLIASSDSAETAILQRLAIGPAPRDLLNKHVAEQCPDLCKDLKPQSIYKLVDNKLQLLRGMGRVIAQERGIWRLSS